MSKVTPTPFIFAELAETVMGGFYKPTMRNNIERGFVIYMEVCNLKLEKLDTPQKGVRFDIYTMENLCIYSHI